MIQLSAEIIEMTAQPISLKEAKFKNTSSQAAKFSAPITESVSDTSTSTWYIGGKFSMSEMIKYGIKILGIGGGGGEQLPSRSRGEKAVRIRDKLHWDHQSVST